jgi:hypothetical protein
MLRISSALRDGTSSLRPISTNWHRPKCRARVERSTVFPSPQAIRQRQFEGKSIDRTAKHFNNCGDHNIVFDAKPSFKNKPMEKCELHRSPQNYKMACS